MKLTAVNPRTGEADYTFEAATATELHAISTGLRAAQPRWESSGAPHRATALLAWKERIASNIDPLVDVLVADTGRLVESRIEVDAVLRTIDRWAALGPQLLAQNQPQPAALPFVSVAQTARAYPLAGVISPWNFPLLLSLIDTIPALMAGCAVIAKPSEIAPRFIDALTQTLTAQIKEVLSFVLGDAGTGRALIDVADLICFTGSVKTGRAVAMQAAQRFIPAFLELGGKDPAIVLDSADPRRTAQALLWGSTANAGQACQSIERIYAQRGICQTLLDELCEQAGAVGLAFPEPSSGAIGPIISPAQRSIIQEHLDDAISKGAKALSGGVIEQLGGGAYLRPTVLVDVDHSMKVMTEETFGPILPVMPFDEIQEAIALANDTEFGLSAAVFAATTEEALAVARMIDAGAVSINDAALTAFVQDGEKSSFKMSGLGGSRMGPASLRRFLRRQAMLINTNQTPDPWWHTT